MSRRNQSNQSEEDTVSNEKTSETEAQEGEATETKKAKQTRHDLPEGYVTPVGLTNALNARLGRKSGEEGAIRPQMIYGYLKNNNANFRESVGLTDHTDGRKILVLSQGLAWWDAKEERKSARATKAQEKAAAETSSE